MSFLPFPILLVNDRLASPLSFPEHDWCCLVCLDIGEDTSLRLTRHGTALE